MCYNVNVTCVTMLMLHVFTMLMLHVFTMLMLHVFTIGLFHIPLLCCKTKEG